MLAGARPVSTCRMTLCLLVAPSSNDCWDSLATIESGGACAISCRYSRGANRRVGNVAVLDGPVWLCERVQKERGETEPTLVSAFISSALNPVGNGTEDNLIMYHADNVMHCKLSKHFVVSNL